MIKHLITWLLCYRQIDNFPNHNKHLADPKEGSSVYRPRRAAHPGHFRHELRVPPPGSVKAGQNDPGKARRRQRNGVARAFP
jgi:hypothetical protein